MKHWIKAKGVLRVQKNHGKVFLELDYDFVNLYKWFIQRGLKIDFDTPRHGAHVSLVLPTIHKDAKIERAMPWNGDKIDFEYCVETFEGGSRKGHRNFWLRVRSPELDKIKTAIGVKDDGKFLGLHVTVGNTKGGVRKWQPKTIEIR